MKETEYICTHCKKRFKKPAIIYNRYSSSEPEGFKETYGCPTCGYDGIEKIRSVGITKAELKQYTMLMRETEREALRLADLRTQSKDTNELYELIENNKLRCMALLMNTQQFIYSIDDSLIRQIFTLRYINGYGWARVASELGGYYSPDYVRITHDRYLKSIGNCEALTEDDICGD